MSMNKGAWFALHFCFLVGMVTLQASDSVPVKMEFNMMQRIDNHWTKVILRNRTFIYEEGHWEIRDKESVPKTDLRHIFHPTPEQWLEFGKAIKEARIDRWAINYANPGVEDGTEWDLKLTMDGHDISSAGDNNYLADGHEGWASNVPAPSRAFQAFLDGIKKVTGHEVQSFGSMTGR